MPQWLPGGMCCWQWTCALLRWWAELKDGPVTVRPHSLSCSYFLSVWPYWKSWMRLSDQTPRYWFEPVKIHLDGFKNNQNSWVILVFSVHAPSAHLATFCFTEHEHHYQQKRSWRKSSENTHRPITFPTGQELQWWQEETPRSPAMPISLFHGVLITHQWRYMIH